LYCISLQSPKLEACTILEVFFMQGGVREGEA